MLWVVSNSFPVEITMYLTKKPQFYIMDRIWEPVVFVLASVVLTYFFYKGLKHMILKHDDEYKAFKDKQKKDKKK